MDKPIEIEGNWAGRYSEMQSFYTRLNQLKRDGLIKKRKGKTGSIWAITNRGLNWVKNHKVKNKSSVPSRGMMKVIISYDVPEKNSMDRRWLREMLGTMGFSIVHRSVWIGNGPLPEDFLQMLREKGLVDCVHIFEVGNRGTLREFFTH